MSYQVRARKWRPQTVDDLVGHKQGTETLKIAICDVFVFQAEDGIRDLTVTGVQTCALPICIAQIPGRENPAPGLPPESRRRASCAPVSASAFPCPQVQPGAGAVRPVVSGRSNMRFIHCTAPPAAPLVRLSMAHRTATAPPATAPPMCA